MAEPVPALVSGAVDTLDDLIRAGQARGIDVDARLSSGAQLLERFASCFVLTVGLRLTEVLDAPQFKALIASDVLAPETLEVVGRAGRALATQSNEACGQTGLFGALGAAQDPDIQRALNFALGFARSFGRNMNCAPALSDGR